MNLRLLGLSALAAVLAIVLWYDLSKPPKATKQPAQIAFKPQAAHAAGQGTPAVGRTQPATNSDPDQPVVRQQMEQTSQPAALAAYLSLTTEQFREIAERPLFSKTRRPPPPAPKPAPRVARKPPPPRMPPLQVKLMGIVASNGTQFALLQDRTTRSALRVSVGDEVQGWKVHSIKGANVRLSHRHWRRELELFKK